MTEAVRLDVGTAAPAFTLPDSQNSPVSLSEFRGSKTIVYFYPAANTPGCTKEACDFRDNLGRLGTEGFRVVGISKDTPAKLAGFAEDQSLTFPLLSDESLEVHKAYGAYGEKSLYGKIVLGTIRSTFVIDENGILTHALYNVKATGHVAMLRKRLGLSS